MRVYLLVRRCELIQGCEVYRVHPRWRCIPPRSSLLRGSEHQGCKSHRAAPAQRSVEGCCRRSGRRSAVSGVDPARADLVQVIDPGGVEAACPALNTMHGVAFLQQQLRR